MMWVSLLTGFIAGFLCLTILEVCVILYALNRVLQGRHTPSTSPSSCADDATVSFNPPQIFLEGNMWVAPLPAPSSTKEIIKVIVPKEKAKDHWRRKDSGDDCVEVFPSRRHARLENNILTLVADDGSKERIKMRGCQVVAVSGGKEMSRKWAKKYPIKLESFDWELSVKSSVCLLYLNTSWEKETWCQVLRAAARWTAENEDWYISRKREFHEYCEQLNEAYPAFAKINKYKTKNEDEGGKIDKSDGKIDKSDVLAGLSRRQRIWKRITKKGSLKESSLAYKEIKGPANASSTVVASKSATDLTIFPSVDSQAPIEGSSGGQVMGNSSPFHSLPDKIYTDDIHSLSDSSRSLEYTVSDDLAMSIPDQGAMCWNILCSRLFFDGYHSSRFQEACHKLIQKQLSKIVTPPYMGRINCTKLELGSKPPFFHSMQVLPKCPDFIWSFEAVVEYSGGARITIDTRLDVRDSASQEKVVSQSLEPTLAGAAADILMKGLETVEKHSNDDSEVGQLESEASSNNGGSQPSKGRWKAMLARVADQVSLVPITMSMRLVSLKGTLRMQIKPPPTDRIWFGFTSMPTIELQPEPSIGDHKITTGPLITFIANRIKMLVQETLVLPNCEGIWVPWMVAETDDWIPQTEMPVPWSCLETRDSLAREEAQTTKKDSMAKVITEMHPAGKEPVVKHSTLSNEAYESDSSHEHELERPLLENSAEVDHGGSAAQRDISLTPGSARIRNLKTSDAVDGGSRSSRRARVLNLGKMVTEKFDEKRRLMVEKVREGLEKYEKYEQGGK